MSEAQGGHKSTLRGILSTQLPHSQMGPEWACIPVHVYLSDFEDQAADPHQLWVQCRFRRHRHYRLVGKELCCLITQLTRGTQGDRVVRFSWSVAHESPSNLTHYYGFSFTRTLALVAYLPSSMISGRETTRALISEAFNEARGEFDSTIRLLLSLIFLNRRHFYHSTIHPPHAMLKHECNETERTSTLYVALLRIP
jgi:hypothetical protein